MKVACAIPLSICFGDKTLSRFITLQCTVEIYNFFFSGNHMAIFYGHFEINCKLFLNFETKTDANCFFSIFTFHITVLIFQIHVV